MSLRGLAWVLVFAAAVGALLAVDKALIDPVAQRMAATDFTAINQWRGAVALALLAAFVAAFGLGLRHWAKQHAPAGAGTDTQQDRTN